MTIFKTCLPTLVFFASMMLTCGLSIISAWAQATGPIMGPGAGTHAPGTFSPPATSSGTAPGTVPGGSKPPSGDTPPGSPPSNSSGTVSGQNQGKR